MFDSGDVVLNTGSDDSADRSTEFGRAFALGIFFGVHFGGFDADRSRNLGDVIAEIFGEFRGGAQLERFTVQFHQFGGERTVILTPLGQPFFGGTFAIGIGFVL